jgi:hypothetical protein
MTMKMRLALLGGALGLATVPSIASAADATASANIDATVVAPITITKTAELNFGNFAADSDATGTVAIATDGTRTFSGGASRVTSGTGTVTAASFNVTGEGTSTFSIVLPTTVTLTHTNATNTMSVGTFASDPSGTGTLVGGAAAVKVGAILTVAAAQVVGVYSNASGLPVTVAYN